MRLFRLFDYLKIQSSTLYLNKVSKANSTGYSQGVVDSFQSNTINRPNLDVWPLSTHFADVDIQRRVGGSQRVCVSNRARDPFKTPYETRGYCLLSYRGGDKILKKRLQITYKSFRLPTLPYKNSCSSGHTSF